MYFPRYSFVDKKSYFFWGKIIDLLWRINIYKETLPFYKPLNSILFDFIRFNRFYLLLPIFFLIFIQLKIKYPFFNKFLSIQIIENFGIRQDIILLGISIYHSLWGLNTYLIKTIYHSFSYLLPWITPQVLSAEQEPPRFRSFLPNSWWPNHLMSRRRMAFWRETGPDRCRPISCSSESTQMNWIWRPSYGGNHLTPGFRNILD